MEFSSTFLNRFKISEISDFFLFGPFLVDNVSLAYWNNVVLAEFIYMCENVHNDVVTVV